MRKKLLRTLVVSVSLILLLLILVPVVFSANVDELIKRNVNNAITGTLDFEDSGISLFRNFPNVSISLGNVVLTTAEPYEGDTLLVAGKAGMAMGIGQLFKGKNEAIEIKSLYIEDASLFLKVDKDENTNYDLAVESDTTTTEDTGFTFALNGYTISNSNIYYDNQATEINLSILDIDHQGEGDLSLDDTELQTNTRGLVSFAMDNITYLNKNQVKLEALIGIDFRSQKYSFLENTAYVNNLPLIFDGYVQLFDNYDEVAINFKTPDSDFKNFLAVIPDAYAKNLEDVETAGTFKVAGKIYGRNDDTYIPKFEIDINSENASFKFPELPKAVKNIHISAQVLNKTGIVENTYVSIDNVSFSIDGQTFNLSSRISDLLGNTKVDAKIKGILDLGKLEKVYPLESFSNLKGILNADVATNFDMAAIENKQYERVKSSGTADLKNFQYTSEDFPEPLVINTLNLNFSPKRAQVNKLDGALGETDFNITGQIDNILGYLFNEEKIKGNFNLKSSTANLDDFIVDQSGKTASVNEDKSDNTEEGLQIPSFLDCTINTTITNLIYDNLELKNLTGTLRIQDQKAGLYGMQAELLGGRINFEGGVSTLSDKPVFDMKLNLAELGISQTFKNVKLLQMLAPVAQALEGKLTSEIIIEGSLLKDLNLDLNTITGGALAELTTAELKPESAKILNALAGQLRFLKPENFNLKALKTALTFEDGLVKVAPFSLTYEDIDLEVEGGHSFDAALNYKVTLQVPAKYLGTEVNTLIAKIGEEELKEVTIPVIAMIKGDYLKPKVTTDLTTGVKNLTTQLVAIQKQKLIDKGTTKTKDLIEGMIKGKSKDSTQVQDSTKTDVGNVVRDIFNRGTKKDSIPKMPDDSTKAKRDPVKEVTQGVLGGILGRKKKDSSAVKKDSIK